ncbi:MAG TPA: hypothetical protein DEB17_11205 [Chlorobaculum sp.]|jgi:hypothetical protein|uniref:Uncharacterized protein n=1 Tax=Chlorobaculum tepidum (strain ATCC 49652 / DSM 12025 / NBRC 103806 / TLS) TaxID=194439 RepID=Q8KCN6_CHLTE|nr:hypothetical protein [Chlorobaculum tepidum]AAM72606.1 hypothetical protein CT1377 [Chlorobaculum tepidum TLS]HBU24536.1 hypothetical protein [Chlorobaculum sp.]
MGDAARQAADRLDLLGLKKLMFQLGSLLFGLFPAADVPEKDKRAMLTGKNEGNG